MVGSAILRKLQELGRETLTQDSSLLDLRDQSAVRRFLKAERPDVILLAAARVGGIHANNTYPAEFIYDNLMIQANVIEQANQADINQLLILGSSCIYPKHTAQPMAEESLLTGKLEPTNEPYAIAKIAGLKLCESYNRQYGRDYRSVMPTNLYGPGDNFHPTNSHVLPALMQRFDEAVRSGSAEVTVWGTGEARREFLFVEDLADACRFVLEMSSEIYLKNTTEMQRHINIGTGKEISIADLATLLADITGYKGKINFDSTKPDGSSRKLLNVSRLTNMGWRANTKLRRGVEITYEWYLQHAGVLRQK